MSTLDKADDCEVLIVGAGLSGLIAGIALQLKGRRSHIIERSARPGGLCGNYTSDGYEFTIACNDFGTGMRDTLKALGVDVEFNKQKTLIVTDDRRYSLPPNSATLGLLLANPRGIYRYYRGVFGADARVHADEGLSRFVDGVFRDKRPRALFKLPAYLMGVAADDFPVSALADEVKYKFGYHQPLTPVGGPNALVTALVERYLELGGDISYNREYLASSAVAGGVRVETSRGLIDAAKVITTVDWSSHEARALRRGLPISVLHVALDRSFRYPSGVHTVVHYPGDAGDWFAELEAGRQPGRFGFHLYRCGSRHAHDYQAVNIYFYQPRNDGGTGYALSEEVEVYIFDAIERMLPGFGAALLYKCYVSPEEFERRHRLSSRVMPYVMPADFSKPTSAGETPGVYGAGNACHPPGDHAGAAIQSALLAAEAVMEVSR